jgi:hypothetical protein
MCFGITFAIYGDYLYICAAALAVGVAVLYKQTKQKQLTILTAGEVAQKWEDGLRGKVVAITGCNK